ncbi:Uncharacterized protein dnm_010370 [Desulfonema magnum]|uniref:Uncharacterized protein n=1 Tax=Desulfonema magnum TaxID=45655 RepID=A0A975GLP5_9BACT|nr:Uncharacterized protein dnm_010370 [Desulfonema magnum]
MWCLLKMLILNLQVFPVIPAKAGIHSSRNVASAKNGFLLSQE